MYLCICTTRIICIIKATRGKSEKYLIKSSCCMYTRPLGEQTPQSWKNHNKLLEITVIREKMMDVAISDCSRPRIIVISSSSSGIILLWWSCMNFNIENKIRLSSDYANGLCFILLLLLYSLCNRRWCIGTCARGI